MGLDPRDMKSAYVVSDENGYYDSQNIISVFDKNIGKQVLSGILHHSRNHEGGRGLTLCSSRSEDQGMTWSALKPVEEPETVVDCRAYNVKKKDDKARQSHDGYQLLVGDRIYLFYGWNRGSQPPQGEPLTRTDMQLDEGFWMRWSDDFGKTFSGGRVVIPVRRTSIDEINPWKGKTIGAFCCDKPTLVDGMVYFAFQKTADGNGESYGSEVFFMRSKNLLDLHEKNNPQGAVWETLPLGNHGVQTDRGLLLGEEPHVLQISGAKLMCFWRTELGFLDSQYSNDYGETWHNAGLPQPLNYSPSPLQSSVKVECKREQKIVQKVQGAVERNEDLIKDSADYMEGEEYKNMVWRNQLIMRNPRGAITPHKMKDGHIALLYYNNGYTEKVGYVGRLVVWLTIGRVEGQEGKQEIRWSQPEVALWWDGLLLGNREDWNEDWAIVDGAGYHDIQELEDGNLAFVESNKLTVRYHEIPVSVLDSMKKQLSPSKITSVDDIMDGPVFKWKKSMNTAGRHRAPVLPDLRAGGGFSFVCWIDMTKIPVGFEGRKMIVNGMSSVSGSLDEEDAEDITKGFKIEAVDNTIVLFLTDGFKTEFEFKVFEVDQCDQPQIEEFYKIKRSTNNKTANRSQTAMF